MKKANKFKKKKENLSESSLPISTKKKEKKLLLLFN